MAAIVGEPRFWPVLHGDDRVSDAVRARALVAAGRRLRGAPFAYAAGRAPFRHLSLDVDENVLIPRQETELLVEIVLSACASGGCGSGGGDGIAVDIGTGTGAIALALASEGGFDSVIATDVSLDALGVARRNVARLGGALRAPVELRAGSLFAPLGGMMARVIVSNPPYIALHERQALPPGVRDWEPAVALFSAGDGMKTTVEIVDRAPAALLPGGLLALELDSRRARVAAERAHATGAFSDVDVLRDLSGRERYLRAIRRR